MPAKLKAELGPQKQCQSLRFKCNRLLYLNRGLPGSAVYDLSTDRQRPCPRCHRRRHLKDYQCRRFDTVFGRLAVRAPRFDGCRHCGERLIASPVSELLPERVSPELRHLQAELAAQLPYRQAAALLEELLPETGGLNYATTRNRTLDVGKRIEEEIRGEIDHSPCCPRTG
jgi:hypothetical protein